MQNQALEPGDYRAFLADYFWTQKAGVLLLAALLLGSTGLQLAAPQLVGAFIDQAQQRASLGALTNLALIYFGVVLAGQTLSVATTYWSESIGWNATNRLRNDLAAHCLRLDLTFYQQHLPGELIERVDGDINTLANFFSTFILRVVTTLLLLAGTLLLLLVIEWRIGLALIGYTIVSALVLRRVQGVGVPSIRAFRQSSADQSGFWEEYLVGLEDLRANGARAYVMRRMHELMRVQWRHGVISNLMSWVVVNVSIVLFAVGNAITFGLGASLFFAGLLSLGQIYALIRYTDILSTNLRTIMREMTDLQAATASLQRVRELQAIRPQITDGPLDRLPDGPLAVSFEHVTFGYQAAAPTLHDITFRLAPGRVLGLVGHTGSGKTTLTRLLFRFYDPTDGRIQINDIDLRQVQLQALRERIGLITQEVQLFHATIRDNLTFFDRRIGDDRILAAIRQLGLQRWLQSLPDGLDTMLAGQGGLSAGEAQLLALTRVLLRDPAIVIMDEASSRLDPATEQLIEAAITSLLAGRTAIIIAHRLATMRWADEIMVLDHGRVCEHRQRAQVLNDPSSRFFQLWQASIQEVT